MSSDLKYSSHSPFQKAENNESADQSCLGETKQLKHLSSEIIHFNADNT